MQTDEIRIRKMCASSCKALQLLNNILPLLYEKCTRYIVHKTHNSPYGEAIYCLTEELVTIQIRPEAKPEPARSWRMLNSAAHVFTCFCRAPELIFRSIKSKCHGHSS